MRESLRVEKEAHAITHVELDKCKTRITELEALVRNAATKAAEGEEPIFEPRVEGVDTNVEMHSKGEIESEIANIVRVQMWKDVGMVGLRTILVS